MAIPRTDETCPSGRFTARIRVCQSLAPDRQRTHAMASADLAQDGELSNAHNFHDPLTGDVNLRTGRVHLSLAVPVVPGIAGLDVDLGLEYSQPLPGTDHRILGLPAPWRYRLSYIVGGQLIVNGGATYTVDPTWPQGLRYSSVKNMHLETFDFLPELPFDPPDSHRTYRNVLSFQNGAKQYFDKSGRLIASEDVHGNHILYYYNEADDTSVLQSTLHRVVDTYGQTFTFTHEEMATQITFPHAEGTARSIRFEFYKTSEVLRMKRYVGPTGRETLFSHTDGRTTKGLLASIQSPSGLVTEFAYAWLPARRAREEELLDVVGRVVRTSQDTSHITRYEFVRDGDRRNYTGYPARFFNPNLRDLLMERRRNRFRYVTTVDDGITYTRHIYNHFHLEMQTEVYASAGPGELISKTLFLYPGQDENGFFPPLRELIAEFPDYQIPIQVETRTYQSDNAESCRSQKKTLDYNDQGQLTRTEESVAVDGKTFQTEKVETFDYDPRFGLVTRHEVHDYRAAGELTATPVVTRTARTLNLEGSLVEESEVGFVKADEFKPARHSTFDHDLQGRIIWQESKDLTRNDGLLASQELSYSYDPAKHRLTLTSKDDYGFTTLQESDTTLGLVVSETDTRNSVATHTYDGLGRKTSTVDPLNTTTKWIYDDTQRTVTEVKANGYQTVTECNSLGLVIRQSDNAGPNKGKRTLATRTYDEHGRLLSESGILGDNSKVTHEYDDRGRLSKVRDALGNERTFTYDEVARTQSESFNGILSHKRTFNDRQQVTVEEIIPSTQGVSQVTSTGHDGFGQVVLKKQGSKTQPDFLTHRITRDVEGNALTTEVQTSDGTQVIHEEGRDLFGNVVRTQRTLRKGNETTSARGNTFSYDSINRLDYILLPKGRMESFFNDAHGNPTTWHILGGGPLFNQEYDARNALTRMDFTEGAVKREFVRTYDPQTQRLLSLEHLEGGKSSDKIEYTYTADGLITSLQYKPDGRTLKWEHSSQNNQLVRFTDSTGTRFQLTYTPQGQLKTKTVNPLPGLPLPLPGTFVGSITFDYYSKAESAAHSGKLKTLSHTLTAFTTFTYDGFGRVHQAITKPLPLDIIAPALLSITYTYDDITGNLIRLAYASPSQPQNAALNRQVDSQYNGLGQLTQEEEKNASGALLTRRAYAYDVAGNVVKRILTRAGKVETTQFEYDEDNQLVSIKDPSGTQRIPVHDGRGNLTEDGAGRKFSYNLLNQLTGFVDTEGKSFAYDYHPDGLRKSKYRADGTALRYYYDADEVPNLVHEARGKMSAAQTFEADTHLSGAMVGSMRVARRDPELLQVRQLLLHDQGHVIAQRTYTGDILGGVQFDGNRFSAYGERDGSSGAVQDAFDLKANPFGFKGEYRDAESGLIYMRARYYDPGLMRFMTLDSVPLFNRYEYANGNPVMLSDPTGHAWGFWGWFGLVASVVAAVATVGIAGLVVGSVGLAGAIAIGATAGFAGSLTGSVFNAIDQSAQGNGSFSDNFFSRDTALNVLIGTAGGAIGGGVGSAFKAAGQGLTKLASSNSFLGSETVKFAARHTATALTGLLEGAGVNVTSQLATTGTVTIDGSFFATLGAASAGSFLAKSLYFRGAQRNLIRQRAANNPYVLRSNPALDSSFSLGGGTGFVMPSPYRRFYAGSGLMTEFSPA
ncbi:RHS repeat domain-containing protein [Corallococcus carmarthensis]|uniref:RHS repeat domain-containing protein n=1 Tax=Corallococcus carmarthensis TaxID=2316728 RepID=UPI00148DB2B4|nr:RHS repeat-associated core domain-containing protein [Corallococcus carmarthensis]